MFGGGCATVECALLSLATAFRYLAHGSSLLARWEPAGAYPGDDVEECYRCDTGATLTRMPTKRRRHAITETPRVEAALDELRQESGADGVDLGELIVLGAGVKLGAIRSERDGGATKRQRLADRVRSRAIGADVAAADEVRSAGWARP